MKKLIHLLCVLLAVCMLPVCAWAEAPVVPSMIDERAEITVVGESTGSKCLCSMIRVYGISRSF